MAHVVGVPKRDPCAKCSLPVFLAERLVIGLNIYHRTCLKCARCSSQLTLGSFYETEVDGEFCCETCPDEEEKENQANRSSIADRLAFFESAQIDEKVLSKSMSDEEKSKSLKAAIAPTYKTNAAFSNFVNETVMDEDQTDNSDHHSDDDIPELPSSSPPLPRTFTSSSSIVVKSNKTSPTANDALKSISSEETKDIDSIKVNSNNEESPENVASPKLDLETTNRLSLVRSRLNQFEVIESSLEEEEQKAIPTDPIIEHVPETKSEPNENISTVELSIIQENDVTEDILEPTTSEVDDIVVVPLKLDDSPTINTPAEEQVTLEEQQVSTEEKVISEETTISKNEDLDEIPVQNVPSLEKTEEDSSTTETILNANIPDIIVENDDEVEKPEQVTLNNGEDHPNDSDFQEISLHKNEETSPVEVVLEKEEALDLEDKSVDPKNDDENYPDYLNPFQSDDDQEEKEPKPSSLPSNVVTSTPAANDSLNPFDSSDDEVELEKVKAKPPRPPPPKVSKNPFGSESEEEENAIKLSSENKTPIPKPRT